MDSIDALRKDLNSLQDPTASLDTKQQILNSIYFRFKSFDSHVSKDIEESFRQLEKEHRYSIKTSSQSSLKLPLIQKCQALRDQPINIETQRKVLQQIVKKQNKQKEKYHEQKPRKPTFKHLYSHSGSLNNFQKFYCFERVPLTEEDYATRGIYSLINTYRTNNVDIQYLEPAKPKAFRNKLSHRNYEQKLSNINVLAKSSNFRTTIKLLGQEAANPFITNPSTTIKEQKSEVSQDAHAKQKQPKNDKSTGKTTPEFSNQNLKVLVFEDLSYLRILNYQLVKDQQMELFKLEHLPSWGRILTSIHFIIKFLKKYRLKSATIRGSLLLQMDCVNRRVPDSELIKCFASPHLYENAHKDHRSVQFRRDRNSAASAIQRIWRSVIVIKRAKQIQDKMLIVVNKVACLWRRKMLRKQIKNQFQHKIEKCSQMQRLMHDKWEDYNQAVQIHIPSFSLSQWHRLTTHHMTSFENQISRLWRSSVKPVIIILPAANQKLLKEYFRRFPTETIELNIIVPQNISFFPSYLPLSSVLYYSFGSLNRIKNIVGKRKAYIVPGHVGSLNNQILLSSFLNIPLYCSDISLIREWKIFSNYQVFRDSQLPILPCEQIEPNCCLSLLAAKLVALIIKNPHINTWLLKIEGEFAGRGIGSLNLAQDKDIQRVVQQFQEISEESCLQLHGILTKIIQHRVVCCEHLYRKQEFISSLLEKGGIIEAQIQKDLKKLKTYEVCVEAQPDNLHILGVFRCVQMTPFCNQSFIKQQGYDVNQFSRLICSQIIRKDIRGFCSFTFIQTNPIEQSNPIYMIDMKPYLTSVAASTFYFSKPLKYIFIPQISHANIQNSDPFEVMASSKKGATMKDHQTGCIILTMNNSYSMMVLGKDFMELKKYAVEMMRYIQYRGTSTLSGEKEFVRGDYYSLSEIAASLKASS